MKPDETVAFVEKLIDLAKTKGLAGLEVEVGDLRIEFGFIKPPESKDATPPTEKPHA